MAVAVRLARGARQEVAVGPATVAGARVAWPAVASRATVVQVLAAWLPGAVLGLVVQVLADWRLAVSRGAAAPRAPLLAVNRERRAAVARAAIALATAALPGRSGVQLAARARAAALGGRAVRPPA